MTAFPSPQDQPQAAPPVPSNERSSAVREMVRDLRDGLRDGVRDVRDGVRSEQEVQQDIQRTVSDALEAARAAQVAAQQAAGEAGAMQPPPPPPPPPTPPGGASGPDNVEIDWGAEGLVITRTDPQGNTTTVPFDPASMIPPQVTDWLLISVIGLIGIILAFPIGRAIARFIDRRGTTTRMSDELSQRLTSIEQAVDTVAVEMERLSEAHRYTTRLLSERVVAPDFSAAPRSNHAPDFSAAAHSDHEPAHVSPAASAESARPVDSAIRG